MRRVGFGAAIAGNIARTSFLSFAAARSGPTSVQEWHDPAGYTVLTGCLIIVALVAEWLGRRLPSEQISGSRIAAAPNPMRFGWLLGIWLIVVLFATEAWFHTLTGNVTTTWTLTPPIHAKVESLPKATLELLGCDRSSAAHWRDEDGREWTLFFLEWFPTRSRTALLAQVHRPEICLPSAGLVEVGPRRKLSVTLAGFDLTFDSLHFRDARGNNMFVFYCPWEIVPGKGGRNAAFSDNTRSTSLRRVWERERVLGQQVAEFIVKGAASREKAENAVSNQVAGMLGTSIVPRSR